MITTALHNRKLRRVVTIRPAGSSLHAYVDGELAASATLAPDGRIGCTVEPRYRGAGVERPLVERLEADARAAGLRPRAPQPASARLRLTRRISATDHA